VTAVVALGLAVGAAGASENAASREPWASPLEAVERALGQGDIAGAERALRGAYGGGGGEPDLGRHGQGRRWLPAR